MPRYWETGVAGSPAPPCPLAWDPCVFRQVQLAGGLHTRSWPTGLTGGLLVYAEKDATSKKIRESETRVAAAYSAHLITQHPVLIQRLRTSHQVRTTGVAHFWGQWLSLTLPFGK